MVNLLEVHRDLQVLYDAIDEEQSLQVIRIECLRALTRNRLISQEMLEATGDWQAVCLRREKNLQIDTAAKLYDQELRRLCSEPNAPQKIHEFMRSKVPPLDLEVRKRADTAIAPLLGEVLNSIAKQSLRSREEEAADYWKKEGNFDPEEIDEFDREAEDRREAILEALDAGVPREPGDDWVNMDEFLGSDEEFERQRGRILREIACELELYLMILARRIKLGISHSGLGLLDDVDKLPFIFDEFDWEKSERDRTALIAQLEEVTGTSFRESQS